MISGKCGTRATSALAAGLLAIAAALPAGAQDAASADRQAAAAAPTSAVADPAAGSGPGVPVATPMTDLLTRMDALEAQMARLTAQNEELANRQHQIEAKVSAGGPSTDRTGTSTNPTPTAAPIAATPAPVPPVAKSATAGNLSAMTADSAGPAHPTAQRIAAVEAVIKPQTGNAALDDYSYGFRLYTAKLYPEAAQQLKIYIDRYPHDAQISHARNLLGRAYLDDGKPRDAAPWFLLNYKTDPQGARAADSLLNLAEAMRQSGYQPRACVALNEFASTYAAEAKGRLRADYEKTRGGLTCN